MIIWQPKYYKPKGNSHLKEAVHATCAKKLLIYQIMFFETQPKHIPKLAQVGPIQNFEVVT